MISAVLKVFMIYEEPFRFNGKSFSGMILLVIVIRFILFIFGICLGMAAAIAALPLPGKTFFNRMSKLPKSVRSLIDNGIDLAISITNLLSSFTREISNKTNQFAQTTRDKFGQIKRDVEIERLEAESLKYKEKVEETKKEAKI